MNPFAIKYTIPKSLIWFTIAICVAPTLLNLIGINFNFATNFTILNNQTALSNNQLKSTIYFLLKGKFIHIILVTAAIIIALLSAIISLLDYNYKKNAGVPIIGIALLSAAIFDIIHLLTTSQFIFLENPEINAGTITWFLARLFHGALLLIGILIFISKKDVQVKNTESKAIQFLLFFSLNLIIVSIFSFLFFFNSSIEPKLIFETNYISRPFDLIPLFIYVVLALIVLPRFYKINNTKFTETLFLAMIPAILTQIHMSFGSKTTFDNHYMIAQFLRLISYLIPLIGLILNYLETYRNEIKIVDELNKTVTQQKTTKDLLELVLNSSLSGVIAFKAMRDEFGDIIDFKFITVNKEAEKIMFDKSNMLLKSTLLQTSPIHKTNGLFDIYEKVVDTGISKNFVFPFQFENNVIWFSISAVKMESDGFAVTFTDVTEQKNNEQKLIKSEYLYHSIASNIANSAVFLMNNELIYELVEGELLEAIGIDKQNSKNKHIDEALSKESADIFKPIYLKTLNGEFFEFEIESRGKIFQNNFAPIKNNEGKVIYALCIATDITKRKKIERALLNIDKLAITGNIARSIAHEIRNPLTNINLAKTNLKDEVSKQEKELYLSIIERNSDRISKLIDQMLLSSKTSNLLEEECFIEDIINDVIEIANDRIILKQITIEKNIQTNLPLISIDIEKIKMALLNVIINGIEAIEHTNGKITIQVANINNKCTIKITDNGFGIAVDKIKLLFDPFFTEKSNGMGLGLTTSQNIFLAHSGNIDVESEIGKGTTFTISLNFCKINLV